VFVDYYVERGEPHCPEMPAKEMLAYKGPATLAEAKTIVEGVPEFQWIDVMLGVRYSMNECLTDQRNLVDQFRNPIVRANEIRKLVEDATRDLHGS